MRATIKDVAKEAGVSPATVSFILNNKPVSISEATRERVLTAVKKLQYRPNQLAISLVTNTTNTIGVILPDSTNPFFASLSHHMEEKLRSKNMTVIIGNTNGDPVITRKYLQIFSDRRVDGIVLAQLDFEDEEETVKCQELMRNIDIPIIYVDRVIEGCDHYSIAVDQTKIGYLATKYLLSLGHRRIGCASGSIRLKVNANRYHGYTMALHEFGLESDSALLFCDSLSIDCGCKALPCLLGHNVSAIFAFNDMIAYGIYKECKNYNLIIPNDLSVIGVDDIYFSDLLQPPLTTISQPVNEIADEAVKVLLELIANTSKSFSPVKLNPVLKVRGSVKNLSES
ncbi:MAG: LacI family DNA-binding transcriptional regulator [Lachnospiraceae bacterium]|nr:LacI family DNA-binding transcriptional regulator [Lachnospiraceae bacterium]